ncbi:hypothetical protein M409DRAFT_28701 [Zasmidium cellare ATCC 36951]|uniref:Uncharacterized protein n=1 Tax=Zasmidium cellare ATCC 36951 TaxID=1080233 RepID=A0A6A6C4N0_ZASCE|nr:uncharacterized protein M409DRAFT_28701 [Zasmidium cellare ATCC 36951]KAF2160822.1 hypothetical protein M409DRAFT_28701 [Zasmidium cellare ATCC 36951]
MAIGNGITVRIKGADGREIDELKPNEKEPRSFRYRTISATPGTKFEVSVTVEKRFDWKDADCIFVAIAYDDGAEEHLGEVDYTMVWAISSKKDFLGEHLFTAYFMTAAATGATRNVKQDKYRHRSKDDLVSHRACISVYVHRGHLSPNPKKRRLADPLSSFLQSNLKDIDKIKDSKLKINFESFQPLDRKDGNVCEFHFRNINPAEFVNLMTPAPSHPKTKNAGSATPRTNRSDTLDAAAARRSQGLRGIPQRDYSLPNMWQKQGYPWDEHEHESTQVTGADRPARQRYKRPTVVSVSDEDDDDDDDDEIVVQNPRRATKSKPPPQEEAPVNTVEEQHSVPAPASRSDSGTVTGDTDAPAKETKSSAKSKQKRELELDLEEVELDKKAIQIKRRLMNLDD